MKRYFGISIACFSSILMLAGLVMAKPANQLHEVAPLQNHVDMVGDIDGQFPKPAIAAQGTIWVADWSFDGAGCETSGWLQVDNRILSDGKNHWAVAPGGTGGDGNQGNLDFGGIGNIVGMAAVMGEHDLCFEDDGYDNDWNTAIRMDYNGGGANYLSFDYLVDSEGGYDFLQVETDSACASFSQVDYNTDPTGNAAAFRTLEFSVSGFDTAAATTSVDSLPLTDYGAGTHCVYISFFADGAFAPADGLQPSAIKVGCVVDNIALEGSTSYSEDFEDGDLDAGAVNAQFVNTQDATAFGSWTRIFSHITDNDVCSENNSCAWLNTDDTTPTIANDPSMAFGPGQFVVRNWLDDLNHSPWVSLASTPGASGTVLSFRRFPGNFFSTSRGVQNWSVRGKLKVDNTDTPAGGDSIDCITSWGHAFQWNSLSPFRWLTSIFDMESHFDPASRDIQVRFRSSDWQYIAGASPPVPFIPGPGPFWDRVRIGRRVLTGPVLNEGIDSRTQAQDGFATDATSYSGIPNWTPSTDRFGTAAFSRGSELTINAQGPNLVFGDSITINVQDVRGAGGIVSIDWYGAIVDGPHQGLAPSPYTADGNGWFVIPADSTRNTSGAVVANTFFVSLDDNYFRGGDILRYAWLASDAQGGVSSDPQGLTAPPTGGTVADAEAATGGLLEVNYLPVINWGSWDPSVNAEPTPAELAAAAQKNCILYSQGINVRRLSGDANRTSVMYTLDQLGYADQYDVYDHQGLGNTNNHLGGRATVAQATGYSLIIYDRGNSGPGTIMPDGNDLDGEKVDQAGWFQAYLGQATISEAGIATLWVMGSNVVEEKSTNPLITTEMGVVLNGADQGLNVNPDVVGAAAMVFSNGSPANFVGDSYSANGGCPTISNYDGLGTSGSAVATHRYKDPNSATIGDAALVMNADAPNKWNTILQSHPWFHIRDPKTGPSSPEPEDVLMTKVLSAVLPLGCEAGTPTDVGDDDQIDAPPSRTALHQNNPNPFNPMTTIRFDLARDGHVGLKIYDVAGRLVRTLVNEKMTTGRRSAVWNGLDDSGNRVSSGVYFYRLVTDDYSATRKMVVMK